MYLCMCCCYIAETLFSQDRLTTTQTACRSHLGISMISYHRCELTCLFYMMHNNYSTTCSFWFPWLCTQFYCVANCIVKTRHLIQARLPTQASHMRERLVWSDSEVGTYTAGHTMQMVRVLQNLSHPGPCLALPSKQVGLDLDPAQWVPTQRPTQLHAVQITLAPQRLQRQRGCTSKAMFATPPLTASTAGGRRY